jgi:hypothetical protein
VRDVLAEVELAKQRARLFSAARLALVQKYLGPNDAGISLDALEAVLTELMVAANNANQHAQHLLATPVKSHKLDS